MITHRDSRRPEWPSRRLAAEQRSGLSPAMRGAEAASPDDRLDPVLPEVAARTRGSSSRGTVTVSVAVPLACLTRVYFPAAASPPGDARVQRGPYHPGFRRGMPTDGMPGRPGAGEPLIHQLPCRFLVTDADQDSPQALVGGAAVELRESPVTGFPHPFHAPPRHSHYPGNRQIQPATQLILLQVANNSSGQARTGRTRACGRS